ncbi:MAG: rhomboid family intramembrane serine protease [Limnochordales bacterium]|nr:rhomboid family intramembrane serine protease [Limnochordales bacterium]
MSGYGYSPGSLRRWISSSAIHTLIAINVALFLLDFLSGGRLTLLGVKYGPSIYNGQYHRLLTAIFLHSGIFHLLFNSYSLYYLGLPLETMLGKRRFCLLYFLGGLTGNVLSLRFAPLVPSLGASSAIFGLLGYYLFLSLVVPRPSLRQGILTIVVINLLWGFLPGSRVDNFAHLGGLIGGLLAGPLVGIPISYRFTPYGYLYPYSPPRRSYFFERYPVLWSVLSGVAGALLVLLWWWGVQPQV